MGRTDVLLVTIPINRQSLHELIVLNLESKLRTISSWSDWRLIGMVDFKETDFKNSVAYSDYFEVTLSTTPSDLNI